MQKYFFEVRNFIENQYPIFQDKITGANYPPPYHAQIIAQITSYIWIAGIALLIGGSQIFSLLKIREPEFSLWISNNKAVVFIGLFLLNNIGNSMVTTGAFEIYLNNDLVYSRLGSGGRMPNAEDLIAALASKNYVVGSSM